MAERSQAGRVLAGLLFLAVVAFLCAGPRTTAAAATTPTEIAPSDPSPDAQVPPGTAPGATLLLLPCLQEAGAAELSPWASSADAARFAPLEEALAARLRDAGFAVITTAQAIAKPGARRILWEAAVPLTPDTAADAARAADAEVALVVRAEVIRAPGAPPSGLDSTDALIRAEAYRSSDGARLATATTRVTGAGSSAAKADAEALVHGAEPLARALEAPLRSGVVRPVQEPRPIPIILEGRLDWRGYQQAVAIIRETLPEIDALEERRFAAGRFTLQAVCGCEPEEAARRLDGMARGGLRLTASSDGATLRVRAAPIAFPDAAPGSAAPGAAGQDRLP